MLFITALNSHCNLYLV